MENLPTNLPALAEFKFEEHYTNDESSHAEHSEESEHSENWEDIED